MAMHVLHARRLGAEVSLQGAPDALDLLLSEDKALR